MWCCTHRTNFSRGGKSGLQTKEEEQSVAVSQGTPRHLFEGPVDVDHLLDHLIITHTGSPFRATARAATPAVGYPLWATAVGAANNRASTAGQKDLFDGFVNVDHLLHHLASNLMSLQAASGADPILQHRHQRYSLDGAYPTPAVLSEGRGGAKERRDRPTSNQANIKVLRWDRVSANGEGPFPRACRHKRGQWKLCRETGYGCVVRDLFDGLVDVDHLLDHLTNTHEP